MSSAALVLTAALLAASGPLPQEQVAVGDVHAALFYTKRTSPPPTRFTAFAFSGAPIQIWSYAAGRFTDVTRRFPKQIAADAAKEWRYSLEAGRRYHERRGFLAAWAADQYLLGHKARVARTLAGAAKRGELNGGEPASPAAFIRALERLLRSTGYAR